MIEFLYRIVNGDTPIAYELSRDRAIAEMLEEAERDRDFGEPFEVYAAYRVEELYFGDSLEAWEEEWQLVATYIDAMNSRTDTPA